MLPVFEYEHVVAENDLDELRRVYNVRYLDWLIRAAQDHCRALGWPGERFLALGAAWVVRTHYLRYFRPAFLGDELTVRTWVATMRNASSRRRYRVVRRRDGAVILGGETDWAFIDLTTGKPRRVPDEIAGAFSLVEDEV